jgi:hypothetical protein
MPNPPLLLCDTDALVQFFFANEVRPFRKLKDIYGIQSAIVQEVDLEIRWLGKHKDKFVPQLDKALKGDVLRILDPIYFQSFLSSAPVGASWASFQSLGAQYEGYVGRGEAYTFAAALSLGLPALSNDLNAIKTLEANLLTLPTPILRAFDLLAFCHLTGCLELKACDGVRDQLLKNNEHMPKAFMRASFEDGLKNFSPRLQDGAPSPTVEAAKYSTVLHISKIVST